MFFSNRLKATLAGFAASFLLCTSAAAQWLDDKAFYTWAEQSYPALFPTGPAGQTAGTFTYRYYASTQIALGVSGGVVYALGPFSNFDLQRLDTLAAFQCLVFPQRCAATGADVGAANLRYGNTATFSVVGSGLAQPGVTIAVGNRCTSLRQVASFDPAVRNFSCSVSAVGTVPVEVKSQDGAVLYAASFTVPEPQVLLQTSLGDIVVQLNPTAAPTTVNNFLTYVNTGFYNNTLFHRVIPGFVAQGGGYTTGPLFKTPTQVAIKLESANGLVNTRGTIAMARTSVPDSATSQFYFNLVDNNFLNYSSAGSPGYAVFGAIVQGLSVMDQMATVPTADAGGLPSVPVVDVVIRSALQVQ